MIHLPFRSLRLLEGGAAMASRSSASRTRVGMRRVFEVGVSR